MILLDLLVTVIIYCAVPTIYRLVKKQAMGNKSAKIFVIVNSSIVWVVLLVVYLGLHLEIIPNMAAAAIWGFVSYRILIYIPKEKPQMLETNPKQSQKFESEIPSDIESYSNAENNIKVPSSDSNEPSESPNNDKLIIVLSLFVIAIFIFITFFAASYS